MQRYSKKRQAILDCLKNTVIHPTAEWIYGQLKPVYPDLSLATVYRNLDEFEKEGYAVSVGAFAGQEHYDGNVKPHPHAACVRCGRIYDLFSLPDTAKLTEAVSRETGITVTEASISFRGVCADCSAKE